MEPEQKINKQQQDKPISNNQKKQSDEAIKTALVVQLLEFGFDQFYVQKAANITLDKEKAAEIVIKLVQQGPNADLTAYLQPKNYMMEDNQPMVQGNSLVKPNRAKMLFIVNGSLKMGKGKICAQVGHAVLGAYMQIEQTAKYDQKSRIRLHSWENSGGAKIAVKANSLEQMMAIKEKLEKLEININTYIVEDAGHTQIEAGSKTVMAVGPAFSDEFEEITGYLKLL